MANLAELEAELAILRQEYDNINQQRIDAFRDGDTDLANSLLQELAIARRNVLQVQADIAQLQQAQSEAPDPNTANGEPEEPDIVISIPDAVNVNPADVPQEPEVSQEDIDAQSAAAADAGIVNGLLNSAREQAVVREQRNTNPEDWRVKLRLAPGATYLYKAPGVDKNHVLWPLRATDGVVFPYTPRIDMLYQTDYNEYQPTHSNYKHYFYKGSRVNEVQMNATFTAQDTAEADYLLACIHFFRTVGKMFYGQDPERGSPPPLCYLSGFGEYQFNEHPCVLSQFNYTLPDDVDYIRARSVQIGRDDTLQFRRQQGDGARPYYSLSSIWDRLTGANLPKGATSLPPAVGNLSKGQNPTYVPTKIEMSLILLPVQSREQVSKEFSLRDYSSGALLKKGYW